MTRPAALLDAAMTAAQRPRVIEIQRLVAATYSVPLASMSGPARLRTVCRPRQYAMYLCRKLTKHSLIEIGKRFGGRDHTTVLHAVRLVEDLIHRDPELADDIATLTRLLAEDSAQRRAA